MKNVQLYERAGFSNRLRESLTLSVIFIIAFIISAIAMDIIIFPIAYLAVINKQAFTLIFKYTFWIIIVFSFSLFFLRHVYNLKKDGYPVSQILKNILVRPFYFFLFLIVLLMICFILITIINLIYQNNNYLLYKILNV